MDVAKHEPDLWERVGGEQPAALWDYLSDGPFLRREPFTANIQAKAVSPDPFFYAIVDQATGHAVGYAALMRIDAKNRVIEVGSILYSPELQKSRGATEAMYLLARYAFEELGYRRYEWKCNSFHRGSQRAALRLGFRYEGFFRQHMIIKGRSRDTTWFAMLDSEWPARKAEFERWLDRANFDEAGRQRTRLSHGVAVAPVVLPD